MTGLRRLETSMGMSSMSIRKNICRKIEACVVLLVFCQLAFGQTKDRPGAQQADFQRNRATEVSELGKDNYSHVAASSIQIKDVLLKDAGLLVELKRWVAKEATDSGQVVVDSSLSDQAIFDRLEQDVVFRSVATRLLQRYGYLLPAPNPDSSFGKEQEYVLKERARRLVQIEAQEDSESLRSEKNERDVEHNNTCDPQDDADCETPRPRKARSNQRIENQNAIPETIPVAPQDSQPQAPPSRTLRTEYLDQPEQRDRTSSAAEIEYTSSSSKMRTDDAFGSSSAPRDTHRLDDLLASDRTSYADRNGAGGSAGGTDIPNSSSSMPSSWKKPRSRRAEEEATAVKMVRPANPFGDVPSLYDMYVQAAAWQRPATRFGLDMFRNTVNSPDMIPMDLPVGPDYVVGTGDSLAIDLWGSLSQRLVRLVDREGRIVAAGNGPAAGKRQESWRGAVRNSTCACGPQFTGRVRRCLSFSPQNRSGLCGGGRRRARRL